MFDIWWIDDLDTASACRAVTATRDELREAELQELALAAHWATLHDPRTLPEGTGPVLPGTERAKRLGGEGAPLVTEFACAELGMLMGTGFIAADNLIRDALDLRHRHPRMWTALVAGEGRVWKARKVARMVHAAGLGLAQARRIDEDTTPHVDALPWGAFVRLVEAAIIAADPEAAEQRRLAREMEQFVTTGQSDERGLKTLIARAEAGEIIVFVAMCDRLAQILALEGDTSPVGARRARAVGILAQPARALWLLQKHAASAPDAGESGSTAPDSTAQAEQVDGEPDDAPEPADQDDPEDPEEPGEPVPCPTCGTRGGGQVPFPVDPDRLRPRAVLYLRISEEALRARRGVAVLENDGVGPITAGEAIDLLGHCQVSVRPVLDIRDQLPVDAYEVPAQMREALRLSRPTSVFPFSVAAGPHAADLDHTTAYLPLDRGGPPGQTCIENLGPMARFGHRVKTHGRGWRHLQPSPGVYLWRTPHGYWFRVDRNGTTALGRDPEHPVPEPVVSRSALEQHFADVIATT
jgi:hypothetical protein